MATDRQTVGQWIGSIFGKSEKVISEKLTTEEHNQFTAEAGELQSKVTALEGEKATLLADKKTLEDKVTGLDNKVTALEGEKTKLQNDKTELESKVTAAEGERDKYKGWFEKQHGKGKELPENDATSNQDAPGLTDYNAEALAHFRKKNAA